MTNDLSNQLRLLNTFEWHARPATTKETCFAAADRIEKLEAALREIALHPDPYLYNDEMAIIARKALEGEND
jgi:hypothetical protein